MPQLSRGAGPPPAGALEGPPRGAVRIPPSGRPSLVRVESTQAPWFAGLGLLSHRRAPGGRLWLLPAQHPGPLAG